MGNYRSKMDIVADILKVASQQSKKTRIMYQANLSSRVFQKYLAEISDASLIFFNNETNYYTLTPKGKAFLEAYLNYSKTNKHAEKILGEVGAKRQALEKLFSQ